MKPSINAALLLTSHAATLISGFEGVRLKAYRDGDGHWTIGYGHTGPDVHAGLVWTADQAIAALTHDLLTSDNDILWLVSVKLNQNQYDALVSFDYNVGVGHLEHSSVLKLLNAGEYDQAADAMLLYIDPGTSSENGLRKRRAAERELFLRPV